MRTILTWYQSGGPCIVPLSVVGIAGLLILIERFNGIVLQSKIHARPFIERVISLVRAEKVDEALKLCAEHESMLPDLGLVMLRSRTRDEAELLRVAHASSLAIVPALTRRLAWLTALATLAVLFGVLGAIMNLHDALSRLPAAAAAAGGGTLQRGIAYALRPLGIGIFTAIPLVLGHAYLQSQANRIAGQLEEFTARLVNALSDRPDVRLGHRD